jgi:hypothetical protein
MNIAGFDNGEREREREREMLDAANKPSQRSWESWQVTFH